MLLQFVLAHALATLSALVSFAVAINLFRSRRTPQSLLAWLIAFVAVPVAAVPLYLALGTRKLPRRAKQARLGTPKPPHATPSSLVQRVLHGDGIAPARAGNALTLHDDGERAYAALLSLIGEAQRTIDVTVFIVGDDVTGWGVLEALAARARAGVRVRVILDAVGSRAVLRRARRLLASAGGEVRAFMPLVHAPLRGRTNLRSHRKLAVFDSARVFLGGMNFALEYMGASPNGARWRDLAATVAGPVAADASALFASDWLYCGGAPASAPDVVDVAGTSTLQLVPSGPDLPHDTLYDVLLTTIFAARQRIVVVTPYYVPDDALHHALVLAARRGVDVNVVLPARSNHVLADYARREMVRELREAGARLSFFARGMLHAKAMIVDDTFAYLGSPNFDTRSLFLNYEDALVVHDAADIAALQAWAEALRAECAAEDLVTLPRGAWVFEQLARIVSPEL